MPYTNSDLVQYKEFYIVHIQTFTVYIQTCTVYIHTCTVYIQACTVYIHTCTVYINNTRTCRAVNTSVVHQQCFDSPAWNKQNY